MNKVIDRERWIGTTATTMVEDDNTRVQDLLCIFTAVAESDLFKHEIQTWDHEDRTGMYL